MPRVYERVPPIYDPDTGIFWRRGKPAGCKTCYGYLKVWYFGQQPLAHRLAWFLTYGVWPQKQIDHIDGNRLNNAISNLRECDNTQNQQNSKARAHSKIGLKGVGRTRVGRFGAVITINGKRTSLGTFATPEAAHAAYMAAAAKAFGEFARAA